VRVKVADIPGFPKRNITAELYDINHPEQIDALYKEMAASLQSLAETMACDKTPDNPLTRELRARQRIELLKVPIACELANDYMEKGYSLGVFVNFRQTLDELCSRFPDSLAIYGSQPDGERESQIETFQSNDARLIIIMSDAGGVGLSLPDVTGRHPRGGLVMPSHKAVIMRQLFGRFHRDDSKSNCWYRVLLAAGTLEQSIYRSFNIKSNNIDALNDADLTPSEIQHTI
jgi:superfamily II DNA or RNA helicase